MSAEIAKNTWETTSLNNLSEYMMQNKKEKTKSNANTIDALVVAITNVWNHSSGSE